MSDDAGNDRPDAPESPLEDERRPDPSIDEFLDRPTHDPEDWSWLWTGDRPFPIRSHRGAVGRLLVAFKKLFRPLVKAPQADLWDRQRVFNLVLVEALREIRRHDGRIGHLENFVPRALRDLLRHNDALFARVDQRLDRHRRETQDLLRALGGALAVVDAERAGGDGSDEGAREAPPASELENLARLWGEQSYLAFERRFRGSEEEIRERLRVHAERLRPVAGLGPVLDLGCGRGEALAVLADAGLEVRGIDASREMVERCRERGLEADGSGESGTVPRRRERSGGSLREPVAFFFPAVDRGVRTLDLVEDISGPAFGR